jgi:uncharacterized protein (TIGR00369 family)
MKTDRTKRTLTSQEAHPNCVVCSANDPLGLGLEFHTDEGGTTVVSIRDGSRFQGYPGRLHGGIISVLFDAAMTHCLFANGLTGVTASLNIRFLKPVISSRSVTVRAQVEKEKSRLHLLKGTLHQDGELKGKAETKFWIVSPAEGYSEYA